MNGINYHSTSLKISKEINQLWKMGKVLNPTDTWEYIQRMHPSITKTGSMRIHRIAMPDIRKSGGWIKENEK